MRRSRSTAGIAIAGPLSSVFHLTWPEVAALGRRDRLALALSLFSRRRRLGPRFTERRKRPHPLAVVGADSVEVAVVARHVDHSVGDQRITLDAIGGGKLPHFLALGIDG